MERGLAALSQSLVERGGPAPLIVTADFDHALERAFADAGEDFDTVCYIGSGSAHRQVPAHLGGGRRHARRRAEHVRRPRARAPDGDPEDPRPGRPHARAGVGELRRQRGRLHRLPRRARARGRRTGRPRLEAPAQSFPVPRLPAPGLARARPPPPSLGTRASQLPVVGDPGGPGHGRVRGVARARDRRVRPRARRVRAPLSGRLVREPVA